MVKRVKKNKSNKTKIRISIIISVISICIAILSLSFTMYKDMRDYDVNKEIKELQMRGANFEESYKKITLAERNLIDKVESCPGEIDKDNLKKNYQNLIDARHAVISNNNDLLVPFLSEMKDVCMTEVSYGFNKEQLRTIEFSMIIGIWIVLLIVFVMVVKRDL
ncbi:hypothetical protein GOV12_03740 [Candidatus Pacearchaeota archaeon]|nr:hypothetical protein [Candidatus Pacearchaeota archaeon]